MKKALLTSIAALLLATGAASAQGIYMGRDGRVHASIIAGPDGSRWPVLPTFCPNGWGPCPVVLAPPLPSLAYAPPPPPPAVDALRPPPLGWVYGPYTLCTDPSCKALRLSGRRVQEERLLRR
jgi:hypothetical protein